MGYTYSDNWLSSTLNLQVWDFFEDFGTRGLAIGPWGFGRMIVVVWAVAEKPRGHKRP